MLTGLMLLNQLAKRFGDLVGKGLPWYIIGEVFALSVPFIVAMTMPMAVLVAVLYTFSRLSGDNEVTAIRAGGVSLFRFMFPVLIAAIGVAATMVWFNDRVLPESNHSLRKLLTDIGRKQPTFELRERVINEVVPGKLFLQAARIDRLRSVLGDLVIFDLGRPTADRTIYADSGHMAFNETQTDLYLTLYDGSMHERDADDPAMEQRTLYSKQVIRVEGVSNELELGKGTDWRGDREMSIRMMQEEVVKRRDNLRALRDTTAELIASLTPLRESVLNREFPRPADDPPGIRSATANDVKLRVAAETKDSLRRAARTAEKLAARPLSSAGDTASAGEAAATEKPTVQELRRRFVPSRRTGWPPEGEPVAFAAQLRSEFQRSASRVELQRREFNRYSVEIQKKFAIPVAAVVFVLIGAPIGIRFPRGGIGMVIGVSLTVFCVYYVFLIGGEELADRDIVSPFWAMWAPNVLFFSIGCVILNLVGRAGTRRKNGQRLRFQPRSDREPPAASVEGEPA